MVKVVKCTDCMVSVDVGLAVDEVVEGSLAMVGKHPDRLNLDRLLGLVFLILVLSAETFIMRWLARRGYRG